MSKNLNNRQKRNLWLQIKDSDTYRSVIMYYEKGKSVDYIYKRSHADNPLSEDELRRLIVLSIDVYKRYELDGED